MPFWVKINGVPTRVNSLSNQVPVADASVTALSQSVTASFAAEAAARTSAINSSITVLSGNVVSSFVAEAAARSSAISSAIGGLASQTYVNNKITDLVNSAPATLDTLKELADALGSDANFSTTVTNQIANYSGSLANAITALSGNVTASLAAEVTNRTNAINAAVSGLASEAYVNNKVSGSSNGTYVVSWYAQSSGSQSGNNTYKKLLDLPFYVTSSTSNIILQSSWCASSATTQMFGYYVAIDNQTITASYGGNLNKNAAMTLFAMPIGNGAAEGTNFIITSSLSVGWHTASIYGKSQVDAWSTSMADTNAVWTTGYFQGARLLITEESK